MGLTSEAALARHGGPAGVRVIVQEAEADDRARIDSCSGGGAAHGFLCVSLLREGGRILGLTAVGAGAAEVAAEASLAISAGLSITDVALALHPYPSHASALGTLARTAAADSLLEVRPPPPPHPPAIAPRATLPLSPCSPPWAASPPRSSRASASAIAPEQPPPQASGHAAPAVGDATRGLRVCVGAPRAGSAAASRLLLSLVQNRIGGSLQDGWHD